MRRTAKVTLLGALLVAGCFPIELDVAKDGKVLVPREEGFFVVDTAAGQATKVYTPAAGKPVFGRFSPDGQQLLAVVDSGAAMMASGFEFLLVNLADGKAQSLAKFTNGTYALFSPNGSKVTIARVADEKRPPVDDNLPELHLVNVQDKTTTVVATNVASLHRWTKDSQSILVFQITAKEKEGDLYRGSLSMLDVATGQAKPLLAVLGSKDVFFDLSPDGATVLFTARAAAKSDADLKAMEQTQLFELKVADGAVRTVRENVTYAVWSPDGKRALLGTDEDSDLLTLQVADAALTKIEKVAERVPAKVSGGMGSDTRIYPSWAGNDAVVYLSRTAVYGTAGKNLALVRVGVDGKNPKNLQTVIDAAAMK